MGLDRDIGGDQDKGSRQENQGASELRRTVRYQRHQRDAGNEAENHGARTQSDCIALRQICAQNRGVGVGRSQEDMAKSENRSEEHTSELQSPMRISYAVFCLNK